MKVYIYKLFERFWHWMQALLIFFLAITGFEIHGYYEFMGYKAAVQYHDNAAWAFLILIVFAIFWHFTTGEWKNYIPTTKFIKEQVRYYITGIFKGAEHPTKKLVYNKFNPLQRMIYLGLKILVIPVMVLSGFAYMFLNYPNEAYQLNSLDVVAAIHTLGAFFLIVFVIAHVYLTTTGHKPMSSMKAMITGWEEMDEIEAKELVMSAMEHDLKQTKENFLSKKSSKILDEALEMTEEKLGVRKEAKFHDVIANSGAGYFKINSEGVFEEVNNAWVRLYKYNSTEEVIGKHYSLSRSEEEFVKLESTFKKVLSGETIEHGLVMRKCKDGSVGYHTITMTPRMENNKIIGVEGFILDVNPENAASIKWNQ
jgi:thiosulfate reductase cytochrome b subunit